MAGGEWASDPRSVTVAGFCFDARQIKPGDCFVALRAGARDGHQFLAQALAGGAVAAVVEEVCDVALPQLLVQDSLLALGRLGAAARRAFKNPVVGVTGSCGKTSTKEILAVKFEKHQEDKDTKVFIEARLLTNLAKSNNVVNLHDQGSTYVK